MHSVPLSCKLNPNTESTGVHMKILGALIILAGFVLFAQYQYLPAFICIVIGAIFMGKPREQRIDPGESDRPDSEVVRVELPFQKMRSSNSGLRRLAFPVDEVTMNNDDGTSRQEYLRALSSGEDISVADVWFDDYFFDGKLCIRVMTEQGCVGQIRPKDVSTVRAYFGKAVRMIYLEISRIKNERAEEEYHADVVVIEEAESAD